jgi:tRNA(Ile)-lysidine synthetase-like protein
LRLSHKNGTKTLKKLYTEYSIPLNDRENLPVIADDEGVVWVCGIGVAERCVVTKDTKNIIKIDAQIV